MTCRSESLRETNAQKRRRKPNVGEKYDRGDFHVVKRSQDGLQEL
jgi:hypothetical protein